MKRIAILATLTLLTLITASLAKVGVVKTRSGQTLEGEVTEKADEIIIKIKGVETHVQRADVESLVYPEPFDKQFADRMAKLDQKDVRGRIDLAKWAFDRHEYERTRDALDSALLIDPNNREATEMQSLVRGQMRLERAKSDAPVSTPTPMAPAERRYITPADINLIRQKELKSTDSTVRLKFDNDVKRRFIKTSNLQFSEFNVLKPIEQVPKSSTAVMRGWPRM